MKWSILTLTQPSRVEALARLRAVLEPQLGPEAAWSVQSFDPASSLGGNRQRLLEQTPGEYVNWIDDDDLVSPFYVSRILPLLDGVDYCGFRLQLYNAGVPAKPTFHSLRYKGWSEDAAGYYRDISHLNPIRRELALMVPFEGDRGEDNRWAEKLRQLDVVRTEHYIDEVMYHYFFRR